jgi:hypothetical protein
MFWDCEFKRLEAGNKNLQTFEESKKGHCACRNKKQGKWNPTKDSVWGDLAGLYAGFIFSSHAGKSIHASDNFQRQLSNLFI